MDTLDISRFWSLVDRKSGDQCWLWTAGCSSNGYGIFNTKDRMPINAHRFAALISLGEPDGRLVLHSCDNPKCCNPSHLRYGTQKQNMQDAKDRGRASLPPISKPGKLQTLFGADVWNATLTETKVREIWRLHLSGKNTAEIAAATNSPRDAVVDACRGRTWRHLTDAPSLKILAKGGIRRPKMSDADVAKARKLIADGLTNRAIAALLGVSATPISNLRRHGTTWVPKP